MSTNETSSNSTSDSNPAPVINWAMIRANKDANEKMKFKGCHSVFKNIHCYNLFYYVEAMTFCFV